MKEVFRSLWEMQGIELTVRAVPNGHRLLTMDMYSQSAMNLDKLT